MRKAYLDNVKGIAIIFVILGHIISVSNSFEKWFYSFHLPLFFIVSGILIHLCYYKKDRIEFNFMKKLKSFGIPYVTFASFSTLALALLSFLKGESSKVILKGLKSNIKSILLLKGVKATWFLPCIFIGIFLFCTIYNVCKNKKIVPFIISILFLIPFIKIDLVSISSELVLYRGLIAACWIMIGFYAYPKVDGSKVKWSHVLLLLLGSFVFYRLNSKIFDLCYLSLYDPLLYLVCGTIGSFGILLLCKKIEEKNIKLSLLNFLGKNSLTIFGTHMIIITYIKYLIPKLFVGGGTFINNSFISVSIILILVLLIEIPIIYVINHFFPFLIGKSKEKNHE